MRLLTVSLIALAGLAPVAIAQTPAPIPAAPPATAPPAASEPAAMPATPPAVAPPVTAPIVAPPPAPTTPAPVAAAPAATPAPAPAAVVEAPPPPPPPPPAPTDPTAIALLSTLENVCIPAAHGGNMASLTKAAGFKKNNENFVLKRPSFQFTVMAPGSNPTQCRVEIVHPVDPAGPGAPLILALHNWSAVSRGWDLYRNDISDAGGQQLTTRSWEHTADGSAEALVLTTFRKPDGAPTQKAADTSTLFYSVTKAQ